jgi:hypothetical protein
VATRQQQATRSLELELRVVACGYHDPAVVPHTLTTPDHDLVQLGTDLLGLRLILEPVGASDGDVGALQAVGGVVGVDALVVDQPGDGGNVSSMTGQAP